MRRRSQMSTTMQKTTQIRRHDLQVKRGALEKELGSEQLMVVGGAEIDAAKVMYELYERASRLIYYGLRAKGLDPRRAQKVVAGLGAFEDVCEFGETDDYVVLASRVLADIRTLG